MRLPTPSASLATLLALSLALPGQAFAWCGDGIVDGTEECDDGNSDSDDGCVACMVEAYCSDGNLDAGEECDDGNLRDHDGCDNKCHIEEFCGDGVVQANLGEGCEPPGTDLCTLDCERICGDGDLDAGEACDDGNLEAQDGCDASCQLEYCGDGVVQQGLGEECDGSADCDASCQLLCGNGVLDAGEGCDDGNHAWDDGCSATCEVEYCGDHHIQWGAGEQCEPPTPGYCSTSCQILPGVCGDGVIAWHVGETCEPPGSATCDDWCHVIATCGDGIVHSFGGEECEPGLHAGCDPSCQWECGNGALDAGEDCDDGNHDDGDGCDHDCMLEYCGDGLVQAGLGEACEPPGTATCDDWCGDRCGNGVLEAGESCDDGNLDDNDGCDAYCHEEYCGDGIVQPGEQCEPAGSADCDATCQWDVCQQPLGGAWDYNVFACHNYWAGVDVGGRIAARRWILLDSFNIGYEDPGSAGDPVIVAGKALHMNHGTCWGDAEYGNYGRARNVGFQNGGSIELGSSVDFAAECADLLTMSADLSMLPANGIADVDPWNNVTLTGTHGLLNVFDIPGYAMDHAVSFTLDVPPNSTVIMNISGNHVMVQGFQFFFAPGVDPSHTLMNFYEASQVDIMAVGVKSTVLAPNALVWFGNASLTGGLFAYDIEGDGELHHDPFDGFIPCP